MAMTQYFIEIQHQTNKINMEIVSLYIHSAYTVELAYNLSTNSDSPVRMVLIQLQIS